MVSSVATVSHITQFETASLDHEQLGSLYNQLGAIGAEEVVQRAMEELSLRLHEAEGIYRDGDLNKLRKGLRTLTAIAEQIGMQKLARVATDVIECIDRGDATSLAATFSRLTRLGETSLTALWDLQDFTI